MGRKVEGDEDQRRRRARDARKKGDEPSAEGVTSGASKQRHHLPEGEEHAKKLATTRKGKQQVFGRRMRTRPGTRGRRT